MYTKIIREHGVAECSFMEQFVGEDFPLEVSTNITTGWGDLRNEWCFKSPEWASAEFTPYANWNMEHTGYQIGPPSISMY